MLQVPASFVLGISLRWYCYRRRHLTIAFVPAVPHADSVNEQATTLIAARRPLATARAKAHGPEAD